MTKYRELKRHGQSLVAENSMEKVNWPDSKLDGNNTEIGILFVIVIVIPLLALLSFFDNWLRLSGSFLEILIHIKLIIQRKYT